MSKILHLIISLLQHRSQEQSPSAGSTALQTRQSLETAEGEVSEKARGKHQVAHQIGSFRAATEGKVGIWGRDTDQKQKQPSKHGSCASTSASISRSTQRYHRSAVWEYKLKLSFRSPTAPYSLFPSTNSNPHELGSSRRTLLHTVVKTPSFQLPKENNANSSSI